MSLKKHATYNLLGSIVPAVVALITIPLLLKAIGTSRFGALSLVWLLLGQVALFDFGLSRATANQMARLTESAPSERERLLWTSLWANLLFGCLGAGILYFASAPLLGHIFNVEESLRVELRSSLVWMVAAVPLATSIGVLTGALEGQKRFDVVNLLQVLNGTLLQTGPLLAAYFWRTDLHTLVAVAVAGRAVIALLFLLGALHVMGYPIPRLPNISLAKALLSYGAWLSVSAIIVPLFMTLDKFMIGAVLGATAVTYYAVPDQIVRRLSFIPTAIARAAFPVMSSSERAASYQLSLRALRILSAVITPMIVAAITIMPVFLSIWISASFAQEATGIAILLCVGIWLNSLAVIPSSYLQAIGRPDLTAKFHIIEIFPHIIILWASLHYFGVIGAAWALLIITAVDTGLLMSFGKMHIWRMPHFRIASVWIILATLGTLIPAGYTASRVAVAIFIISGTTIWSLLTTPEISRLIRGLFNKN